MSQQKILIAPSILSADFAKLKDEVQAIEAAGADWVHVDIMDGQFVPNITMGPFIVEALNRLTTLPLDVHLMIEYPERYVEAFVKAGADWITVHPEAPGDKFLALDLAARFGAKRGVALKPATPVSHARDYVGLAELVLVMTVNPGFSGQKMIESALPKYAQARTQFGPDVLLEIDGGVMPENAARVRSAGAEVIVAATAIFKAPDYAQAIRDLRGD